MDKDINVKPVNHYVLNLHNDYGKLIATAPQAVGWFVLNQASESTEYTDVNNDSCLLALETTGHASRHDAEKPVLQNHRFAHSCLERLEILPKVVADTPKMTGKCDCKSCIKCKSARKPITPTNTHAIEPLQLVHSDICGPLGTAIRGGRYMLLLIHNTTRKPDEYILKYQSKGLQQFKE